MHTLCILFPPTDIALIRMQSLSGLGLMSTGFRVESLFQKIYTGHGKSDVWQLVMRQADVPE